MLFLNDDDKTTAVSVLPHIEFVPRSDDILRDLIGNSSTHPIRRAKQLITIN